MGKRWTVMDVKGYKKIIDAARFEIRRSGVLLFIDYNEDPCRAFASHEWCDVREYDDALDGAV